jgi:hypothetical protein
MSNTREPSEGFDGQYPKTDDDWAARAYREAGMEPPWLLEYEDGKVIGPRQPTDRAAPRHEA